MDMERGTGYPNGLGAYWPPDTYHGCENARALCGKWLAGTGLRPGRQGGTGKSQDHSKHECVPSDTRHQ